MPCLFPSPCYKRASLLPASMVGLLFPAGSSTWRIWSDERGSHCLRSHGILSGEKCSPLRTMASRPIELQSVEDREEKNQLLGESRRVSVSGTIMISVFESQGPQTQSFVPPHGNLVFSSVNRLELWSWLTSEDRSRYHWLSVGMAWLPSLPSSFVLVTEIEHYLWWLPIFFATEISIPLTISIMFYGLSFSNAGLRLTLTAINISSLLWLIRCCCLASHFKMLPTRQQQEVQFYDIVYGLN